MATGSLLYVVFFEILEKERQKEVSGVLQVRILLSSSDCTVLCQVLSVAAGFIFMALLALAEVSSERKLLEMELNTNMTEIDNLDVF